MLRAEMLRIKLKRKLLQALLLQPKNQKHHQLHLISNLLMLKKKPRMQKKMLPLLLRNRLLLRNKNRKRKKPRMQLIQRSLRISLSQKK